MSQPSRISNLITSGLYYLYRFTSSLSGLYTGKLTQLGVFIVLSFPFVFMVAVTYYRLSTFYLFVLLLVLTLVSFVMSFFRSASCKIRRELPAQALVGEEMVYQVELTNVGKKALRSALIHDSSPDTRPTRKEFLQAKEPGEELRNIVDRFLKYYRWMWLIKRKSSYRSRPSVLDSIESGESKVVSLACTPQRRGKIDFPATKIILPDPLGIFQKSITLAPDPSSVTVLPKRYKLPELDLEGISRNQIGGQSVSRATGQTDEVVGLREYRPGDPPKHIHWRSWAKTGKPMVREYEDVFFPRYGLVLDTACAYEKIDMFEEAVSIAASFVRSVETKECLLDLIFLNQGAQVQTVGTGVAKSEEMLELLATVDVDLEPDWENLSKKVMMHSDSLTACIVVFVTLDDQRKKLLRHWRATGMSILVIVLTEEASDEIETGDPGVVPISMSNIQSDLMKNMIKGLV